MKKYRYDQYGNLNKNGKYDQYGNNLKPEFLINKIIKSLKEYHQSKMVIPTDPTEIKKRANQIRQEIEDQKNMRVELKKLNEDLDLIKYHARVKGKLKEKDDPLNDSYLDYLDHRQNQDKNIIDESD